MTKAASLSIVVVILSLVLPAAFAQTHSFDARWNGASSFEDRWPVPPIATRPAQIATPLPRVPPPPKADTPPGCDASCWRARRYAEWTHWGTSAKGPKLGQAAIFRDGVGWITAVPDPAHVTIRTRTRTMTRAVHDVIDYREGS